MSISAAWEDDFYKERLPPGGVFRRDGCPESNVWRYYGGRRTPYKAWAEAWGRDAADYCRAHGGTKADALKKACAWHLQDACRRLDERTRSRWDLPEKAGFTECLLDRIWRLEAALEDAADFFDLLAVSELPEPEPFRRGVGEDNAPRMPPKRPAALVGYEAALREDYCAAATLDNAFPRREYWPEDEIKKYAQAQALARWALVALKERHSRGLDPRNPETSAGQNLVAEILEKQPFMTAEELRAGLAAFQPENTPAPGAADDSAEKAAEDDDDDTEGEP